MAIPAAGLKIFKVDIGITVKDFICAPALGKDVNGEFSGEASTSHNK